MLEKTNSAELCSLPHAPHSTLQRYIRCMLGCTAMCTNRHMLSCVHCLTRTHSICPYHLHDDSSIDMHLFIKPPYKAMPSSFCFPHVLYLHGKTSRNILVRKRPGSPTPARPLPSLLVLGLVRFFVPGVVWLQCRLPPHLRVPGVVRPLQGSLYVLLATTCVCTFCVYWTEGAIHTALLDDAAA